MRYDGEFFTFDEEKRHVYCSPVELSGDFFGWMNFDDHWHYEHTYAVAVPRDLAPYGIDTSFEDGTSLFKNGVIVFDSLEGKLVYADDAEPSLGGRYHGMCGAAGDTFEDYFDITPDVAVFVLTAN